MVIVQRTRVLATQIVAALGIDGELKVTTIDFGRETTRNSGFATTPGLMGSIKTYFARTSAERQLRQLDDRLLSDIGLKRVDIAKSVWGR
jgi:uncharacterized protein YjiS (DUF1127 family)